MGPKAKLASLLLRHQGSDIKELETYSSEERSAMLFFLTRHGYLAEPDLAVIRRDRRRPFETVGLRYAITQRGQALLDYLVRV